MMSISPLSLKKDRNEENITRRIGIGKHQLFDLMETAMSIKMLGVIKMQTYKRKSRAEPEAGERA